MNKMKDGAAKNSAAPIGVFDSGLGGLTVVREIMRNLPEERVVYFGDTARVPYGNKSKNTVLRYARQIVHFLRAQEVKAIVVACNTASALALDEIEQEIDLPILGVVRPGVHMALEATKNRRVGVIATESTIRSGLYQRLLAEADAEIRVFGKACPLLVPLVEEGWRKDPVTETVARRYLEELLEKDIDTLIMGCTHYPLLRKMLQEIVGEEVTLINPAYETALALDRMLREKGLRAKGVAAGNVPGAVAGAAGEADAAVPVEEGKYRFYASDTVEKFNTFANLILPYDIETTELVQIEEY